MKKIFAIAIIILGALLFNTSLSNACGYDCPNPTPTPTPQSCPRPALENHVDGTVIQTNPSFKATIKHLGKTDCDQPITVSLYEILNRSEFTVPDFVSLKALPTADIISIVNEIKKSRQNREKAEVFILKKGEEKEIEFHYKDTCKDHQGDIHRGDQIIPSDNSFPEIPSGLGLDAGIQGPFGQCFPTPTPTPTPSPSPTPLPSPSQTPAPTNPPVGGNGGAPGAPVCTDAKPDNITLLTVVKTTPASASLSWKKTGSATNYSISYGNSTNNYIYGVTSTGNVDNFVISNLDPKATYCFAIRPWNNCQSGDLSNEVCITPSFATGGQVLGISTLAPTGSLSNLQSALGLAFGISSVLYGIYLKKGYKNNF